MTDMATEAAREMARRRLDRLARLSQEYGHTLNARGVRLLRHAAFEAYLTLNDLCGQPLAELDDAS